jgi:inosine-uridine nucleoside N-ribohydrolase
MNIRWAFPFALVGLALISSAAGAEATRPRVVISTDLATGLQGGWRTGVCDVDDGFAVAMAHYAKRFDVRGVVVTFGNTYLDPEIVAAHRLLRELMKVRIPVVAGAAVPLSDPPTEWTTTPAPALAEPCVNEGVRFLVEELEKGPLTVLALGPLTDVACLVTHFPELSKRNLRNVIAIMGRKPKESFAIGAKTGLTDFNLRRDSRAAKLLLQRSPIPVTLIGFSTTSKGLISSRDVQKRFASDPSALSRFFLQAARRWIAQWKAYGFAEDGFHPWDQNAVYYAMKPQAYACDQRGFAFIDCTPKPGEKENACAGHAPGQPLDSQGEHWQLWLSPDYPTRKVTYCHDYASDQAKADFLKASLRVLP